MVVTLVGLSVTHQKASKYKNLLMWTVENLANSYVGICFAPVNTNMFGDAEIMITVTQFIHLKKTWDGKCGNHGS